MYSTVCGCAMCLLIASNSATLPASPSRSPNTTRKPALVMALNPMTRSLRISVMWTPSAASCRAASSASPIEVPPSCAPAVPAAGGSGVTRSSGSAWSASSDAGPSTLPSWSTSMSAPASKRTRAAGARSTTEIVTRFGQPRSTRAEPIHGNVSTARAAAPVLRSQTLRPLGNAAALMTSAAGVRRAPLTTTSPKARRGSAASSMPPYDSRAAAASVRANRPTRRRSALRDAAARRWPAVTLANGLSVHEKLQCFGDAAPVLGGYDALRRGARRRTGVGDGKRMARGLQHRHVVVRIADRRKVIQRQTHRLGKPAQRVSLGRLRIRHFQIVWLALEDQGRVAHDLRKLRDMRGDARGRVDGEHLHRADVAGRRAVEQRTQVIHHDRLDARQFQIGARALVKLVEVQIIAEVQLQVEAVGFEVVVRAQCRRRLQRRRGQPDAAGRVVDRRTIENDDRSRQAQVCGERPSRREHAPARQTDRGAARGDLRDRVAVAFVDGQRWPDERAVDVERDQRGRFHAAPSQTLSVPNTRASSSRSSPVMRRVRESGRLSPSAGACRTILPSPRPAASTMSRRRERRVASSPSPSMRMWIATGALRAMIALGAFEERVAASERMRAFSNGHASIACSVSSTRSSSGLSSVGATTAAGLPNARRSLTRPLMTTIWSAERIGAASAYHFGNTTTSIAAL